MPQRCPVTCTRGSSALQTIHRPFDGFGITVLCSLMQALEAYAHLTVGKIINIDSILPMTTNDETIREDIRKTSSVLNGVLS